MLTVTEKSAIIGLGITEMGKVYGRTAAEFEAILASAPTPWCWPLRTPAASCTTSTAC